LTDVLGNIAPEELGITLGHEHLLIDMRGLWDNPPIERAHLIDREPTLKNRGELMRNPYDSRPNLLINDSELCIRELMYYKEAGGLGIIDLTTVGIKPDPQGLLSQVFSCASGKVNQKEDPSPGELSTPTCP
jgi:phosphotriesterase-related protein